MSSTPAAATAWRGAARPCVALRGAAVAGCAAASKARTRPDRRRRWCRSQPHRAAAGLARKLSRRGAEAAARAGRWRSTATACLRPATRARSRRSICTAASSCGRATQGAAVRRPGAPARAGGGRQLQGRCDRAVGDRWQAALARAHQCRDPRRPRRSAMTWCWCAASTASCMACRSPMAPRSGSRAAGAEAVAARHQSAAAGRATWRSPASTTAAWMAVPRQRRHAPGIRAVGQPHGNTELERLIDVDAPVVVDGNDLFAVAFQGRVAAAGARHRPVSGRTTCPATVASRWTTTRSTSSTADGEVVALDRTNGAEAVAAEGAGAPRAVPAPRRVRGDGVVVADLRRLSSHWLDRADRRPTLARVRAGKGRVSSPPVVADGLLLVFTDRGVLSAFRASRCRVAPPPQPAPRREPDARRRRCMLPIVALVGRPNVGKSTLFNALTRTRDAIVADVPGVTRDRQYGYARVGRVPCVLIDTGGLVENPKGLEAQMRVQTERAVAEADRADPRRRRARRSDRRRMSSSRASCGAPASRSCWRSTRPRGSTRDWSRRIFMRSGWASRWRSRPATARAAGAARRACSRDLRTGDAQPRARTRCGHPRRDHRPAQRRQVHAGQPPARRGARDRERAARHHARQHPGAVQARRPRLPADRYGRASGGARRSRTRSSAPASPRRCRPSTTRTS